MDWLLGLLGIGGAAVLLTQSKPLPAEADFKKAQATLADSPDDPDANLIAGKYLAFVTGDYATGMQFFLKSKDQTLRKLAEHETDPTAVANPPQMVGMADEWVTAAKAHPALFRIFYDRAAQWYVKAFPGLDDLWKDRARAQGRKLSASRPPGGQRKLPQGWKAGTWPGARAPIVDGSLARTGSYSVKVPSPDEKVAGSYSQLKSDAYPTGGAKTLDLSAYILADGTNDPKDRVYVRFSSSDGTWMGDVGPYVPADVPFWSRLSATIPVPDGATQAELCVLLYSKKGSIWADDLSMKAGGKELIKNGSFEGN